LLLRSLAILDVENEIYHGKVRSAERASLRIMAILKHRGGFAPMDPNLEPIRILNGKKRKEFPSNYNTAHADLPCARVRA
jgi:hypothetical protein